MSEGRDDRFHYALRSFSESLDHFNGLYSASKLAVPIIQSAYGTDVNACIDNLAQLVTLERTRQLGIATAAGDATQPASEASISQWALCAAVAAWTLLSPYEEVTKHTELIIHSFYYPALSLQSAPRCHDVVNHISRLIASSGQWHHAKDIIMSVTTDTLSEAHEIPLSIRALLVKSLITAALEEDAGEVARPVLNIAAQQLFTTALEYITNASIVVKKPSMRQKSAKSSKQQQQSVNVETEAQKVAAVAQHILGPCYLAAKACECQEIASQQLWSSIKKLLLGNQQEHTTPGQRSTGLALLVQFSDALLNQISSIALTTQLWSLLRYYIQSHDDLEKKRALHVLRSTINYAIDHSSDQQVSESLQAASGVSNIAASFAAFFKLFEILDETSCHLVIEVWPAIHTLHGSNDTSAAMPYEWASIIWIKAMSHRHASVQKRVVATLLTMPWYCETSIPPPSFLAEVLFPAFSRSSLSRGAEGAEIRALLPDFFTRYCEAATVESLQGLVIQLLHLISIPGANHFQLHIMSDALVQISSAIKDKKAEDNAEFQASFLTGLHLALKGIHTYGGSAFTVTVYKRIIQCASNSTVYCTNTSTDALYINMIGRCLLEIPLTLMHENGALRHYVADWLKPLLVGKNSSDQINTLVTVLQGILLDAKTGDGSVKMMKKKPTGAAKYDMVARLLLILSLGFDTSKESYAFIQERVFDCITSSSEKLSQSDWIDLRNALFKVAQPEVALVHDSSNQSHDMSDSTAASPAARDGVHNWLLIDCRSNTHGDDEMEYMNGIIDTILDDSNSSHSFEDYSALFEQLCSALEYCRRTIQLLIQDGNTAGTDNYIKKKTGYLKNYIEHVFIQASNRLLVKSEESSSASYTEDQKLVLSIILLRSASWSFMGLRAAAATESVNTKDFFECLWTHHRHGCILNTSKSDSGSSGVMDAAGKRRLWFWRVLDLTLSSSTKEEEYNSRALKLVAEGISTGNVKKDLSLIAMLRCIRTVLPRILMSGDKSGDAYFPMMFKSVDFMPTNEPMGTNTTKKHNSKKSTAEPILLGDKTISNVTELLQWLLQGVALNLLHNQAKRHSGLTPALLATCLHPCFFSSSNSSTIDPDVLHSDEHGVVNAFIHQLLAIATRSSRLHTLLAMQLTGLFAAHPATASKYYSNTITEMCLVGFDDDTLWSPLGAGDVVIDGDLAYDVADLVKPLDAELTEAYAGSIVAPRVAVLCLLSLWAQQDGDDGDAQKAAGLAVWNQLLQKATTDADLIEPQYYYRGPLHKKKIRAWQALTALCPLVSQQDAPTVLPLILDAFALSNAASVKQYQEIVALQLISKDHSLLQSMILPRLRDYTLQKSDAVTSLIAVSVHAATMIASTNSKYEQLLIEVITSIIPWCGSFVHSTRMYSQLVVWHLLTTFDALPASHPVLASWLSFFQTNQDLIKARTAMDAYKPQGSASNTSSSSGLERFDLVKAVTARGILCEEISLLGGFDVQGALEGAPEPLLSTIELYLRDAKAGTRLELAEELKESYKKEIAHASSSTVVNSSEPTTNNTAAVDTSSNGTAAESYQRKITPTDIELPVRDPWGSVLGTTALSINNTAGPTMDTFETDVQDLVDSSTGSSALAINSVNTTHDRHDLIVVASLIDRVPNLAGLTRTCEIFRASLVLDDLSVVKSQEFINISVSSETWVPMQQVKKDKELVPWLEKMALQHGYTLVGLEQTASSIPLPSYEFPKKTVLVLGAEREGIPSDVLQVLHDTVEIPQYGFCRSLNVHVSGAISMYHYCRCHR